LTERPRRTRSLFTATDSLQYGIAYNLVSSYKSESRHAYPEKAADGAAEWLARRFLGIIAA